MKRLSVLIILLLPVFVYAKNKISMVTYFPVPYVAYSQVNVENQLDIGLTDACSMKLGCDESGANLTVNRLNLTSGQLDLNGGRGIDGENMTLGAAVTGTGKISFKNVRIQRGNMESLNAEEMNVSKLKLFGKEFPSCKNANSKSAGQMQWAKLTLDGANGRELYLVCGNLGEAAEETTDCSGLEPDGRQRVCPNGVCGWQYSHYECVEGRWQEVWEECTEFANPLDDVQLLYQAKAACCPKVTREAEFEYWSMYDPSDGWDITPCYKPSKLTYFLGIESWDTGMGPDCLSLFENREDITDCRGKCDPCDVFGRGKFEVSCLNFMELGEKCTWRPRNYECFNSGNVVWDPVHSAVYECGPGEVNF